MANDNPKILVKKEQLDSIQKGVATLAFSLIALIGIRYIAQDLLAPVLLSVFIAVLIFPIFKLYRRRNISRGISMTLTILTFFGGVIAISTFLIWSFSLLFESLSVYIQDFKASFTSLSSTMNLSEEAAGQISRSITPENVMTVVNAVVNSLGNIVFYLIIIPILAIFMVLQADSFPKDFSSNLSKTNSSVKRFKKFADSIIIYISGRAKVNTVTGILFGASLLFLGVDFAVVWGVITIFMSFIPYIGLLIAAIPPVLLAFAEGGIIPAVLVLVAVGLINFFAENIMDPRIQGQNNKISVPTVIISLILWVWLLGPIGALLAIPLTVLLKIVLADFKETHFISLLMEGNYDVKQVNKDKNRLMKLFDKAVNKIPVGNGKK
jgi:AI-2 transport protein TqsA